MIDISFIVPAYNEEALLPSTLEHIRSAAALARQRSEVIVVDDASVDATAAVAARHGARIVSVNRRQIAAVRNAGARHALGKWLIFVDADTQVTSSVVTAAIATLKSGAAGGGCRVRFDGPLPFYARLLIAAVGPVYRGLGLAAGCFIFCSRQAFEAVGGFDETVFAAEEVILSRVLRKQGHFVVLREYVVTSGRKLRMHSGRQVLGTLLRLALGGRSALRNREGKDIWYGERLREKGSGKPAS